MSSLLTWNGIPPQKIGSLTIVQRDRIVAYAAEGTDGRYDCRKEQIPMPLDPFATVVKSVAESFTCWGGSIAPSFLDFSYFV